ncbi:hypothetical protein V6Z11_D11G299600 [Gossypium hirsutum]
MSYFIRDDGPRTLTMAKCEEHRRQTFGYFGETVAEWAVHVLRDKRRKRT